MLDKRREKISKLTLIKLPFKLAKKIIGLLKLIRTGL